MDTEHTMVMSFVSLPVFTNGELNNPVTKQECSGISAVALIGFVKVVPRALPSATGTPAKSVSNAQ
jgi:hypothetical protein